MKAFDGAYKSPPKELIETEIKNINYIYYYSLFFSNITVDSKIANFSIYKGIILEYNNSTTTNFYSEMIICNQDISDLIINNSFQLNLKYISRFTLNNLEIPNSEYFTFAAHSNYKIIDVFYANTKYSNFSSNYLKTILHTSIFNYKFSRYYAA